MEELFNHPHVAENIVSLSLLIPGGCHYVEEQAKETDGDKDEVVPKGTGVAGEASEGIRVY